MDESTVSVDGAEGRRLASEREAEELCRSVADRPSFWLHARRADGAELEVAASRPGASVFYLDMARGVKRISLGPAAGADLVRLVIDDRPDIEMEVERRHVVPREAALDLLQRFLRTDKLPGMVPWPN